MTADLPPRRSVTSELSPNASHPGSEKDSTMTGTLSTRVGRQGKKRSRRSSRACLSAATRASPFDEWTLILSNGPMGTDVGVLPSQAARELRARAIRAVCVADDSPAFAARILEVYGPTVSLLWQSSDPSLPRMMGALGLRDQWSAI